MRRILLAGAVAAAGALLAPAAAQADQLIAMPGKYFEPARTTVLAGEPVTWRNDDFIAHNVAAAGVFGSGAIARTARYSFSFASPGEVDYRCTIHPFMTGHLSVAAVTLSAPTGAVLSGETVTLTGRAARGTTRVGIERSPDGAAWTDTGVTAVPDADGAFSAMVPVAAGTAFRAVVPAGASSAVTPKVAARVPISLEFVRHRRHVVLHVRTAAAGAGLVARAEIYKRERFAWRPAGKAKRLDAGGHARLVVPAAKRGRARVVLSTEPGGLALLTSRPLRLRDGKPTRSPIPSPSDHRSGGEDGREAPAATDDGHGADDHGA